jgi:hypothetical protein
MFQRSQDNFGIKTAKAGSFEGKHRKKKSERP